MAGYLRAVRDLSEPNAWKAPVHTEIISKIPAYQRHLGENRPLPALALPEWRTVMKEFNLRLGYLKYKG